MRYLEAHPRVVLPESGDSHAAEAGGPARQ